jgi:hypothetical protein
MEAICVLPPETKSTPGGLSEAALASKEDLDAKNVDTKDEDRAEGSRRGAYRQEGFGQADRQITEDENGTASRSPHSMMKYVASTMLAPIARR